MSLPFFVKALPVAVIALGVTAVAAAASDRANILDRAEQPVIGTTHDAALNAAHVNGFNVDRQEVGYKKKRRHSTKRRTSRFGGFGFRGDGFRTSGRYN